jgi:hypothetical protein
LAADEAGFPRIAYRYNTQFLLPYEAAIRADFQTAKQSKISSDFRLFKTKKNKPKIEKKSNCCG